MFASGRNRLRVYTAAVSVAGGLSLTACSQGGAPPEAAHSSPASSSTQVTDPQATFMAAYGSHADRVTLSKAMQVKIARCMALHGFTYRTSKPGAAEEATGTGGAVWGDQFRLDLTNDDITKSRREGYGLYRRTDGRAEPKDPNATYVNSLSPSRRKAWDKAMLGDGGRAEATIPGITRVAIPAEGCIGDAHMELYGDLQTYVHVSGVMNGLGIPLKGRWGKDPQVLAAAESWRQCMHSKGFAFKAWSDAWEASAELYEDKNVSRQQAHPEEIRIATADAECSVQTGKSRVERARFATYQQEVLKEWAPQIGQYKQIREAALVKARAELSG
ncbi:hypothetical protein [Streptosporangium sp. NPDC049644]|uniref:hypothetical protein n=1 Tax=Streptosporangium sp. NPDC049644 TaxID=3155507 RepID=UPI003427CD7E